MARVVQDQWRKDRLLRQILPHRPYAPDLALFHAISFRKTHRSRSILPELKPRSPASLQGERRAQGPPACLLANRPTSSRVSTLCPVYLSACELYPRGCPTATSTERGLVPNRQVVADLTGKAKMCAGFVVHRNVENFGKGQLHAHPLIVLLMAVIETSP